MLAGNFELSDLIKAIAALGVQVPDSQKAHLLNLKGFTRDSRDASCVTAFFALPGVSEHGKNYIPSAIEQGATLIFEDVELEENTGLVKQALYGGAEKEYCFVVRATKLTNKLGTFFKILYPQLSTLKQVVAVTGTNGKTSVASLYAQIISRTGNSAGTIGTLGCMQYCNTGASKVVATTINTTPDNVSMFAYLAWFADQKILYVALEASSHGIEQGRTLGLPIDVAVFTNLSQDHLDYHGNMQAYGAAKRKLLNNTSIKGVVINADDPESSQWRRSVTSAQQVVDFSIHMKNSVQAQCSSVLYADQIEYLQSGIQFSLNTQTEKHMVKLPLIGQFNIANYLAALGALLQGGAELSQLTSITPKLTGVKGRMELIHTNTANIIVDFAHTPDALKQALIAARKHTSNNLWLVFGCGGDRDKAKRPIMGSVAVSYADQIILTEDNSRFEEVDQIIDEISKGINNEGNVNSKNVTRIVERKSAIKFALNKADTNDLILVAGKGHEDYIDIRGQKISYDERAYVQKLAGELK